MKHIIPFFLAVVLLLHTGCGGDPSRPDDLPKLYPVNISITQENKPLENATVTLVSKTPSKYGTSSGKTDTAGIAAFRTYGFPGIPIGEYSVIVEKKETVGTREKKTFEGTTVKVGGQVFQRVDVKYTTETTTPLSLSVSENGAEETFEVGAPVRIFVGNNPG